MKSFLLLLLAILFSVCFFSCGKPEQLATKPNYYVKFKQNGVLVTNTGANYGWLKRNSQDTSQMLFQMVSNSTDWKDVFGFTIQKTGSIGPGSYSTVYPYYLTVDYFKDIGTAIEKDYSIIDPNNPSSVFTLTLISITDKDLKGSFSGNLYCGNELMSITEGEFFVRRNP